MIGTFWNLCRACPSLPSDKGRSEYRSTYQWYEYTGAREDIIKQAPQLTSPVKDDVDIGFLPAKIQKLSDEKQTDVRFKNAAEEDANKPEVNIKKNPIYGRKDIYPGKIDEVGAVQNGLVDGNPGKLRSRPDKRDYPPSRRSKSEGPPRANGRKDRYTKILFGGYPPSPEYASIADAAADRMDFDGSEYAIIQNYSHQDGGAAVGAGPAGGAAVVAGGSKNTRGRTEYRLQFAWPKNKAAPVADESNVEESSKYGGNRRQVSAAAALPDSSQPVPVHKKRLHDMGKQRDGAPELEPLVAQADEGTGTGTVEGEIVATTNGKSEKPEKRIEFYSEYKKNFRPFSQYEYVSGRFHAKHDDVDSSSAQNSGSWYEEVLELRKKAGEYKHRGWGTELVPQHLAEVYNKQLALWEHVSRKNSLSALTLATTMKKPRALTKAEKSKENFKKAIPGRAARDMSSLARQPSIDRSAAAYKKGEKYDDGKKGSFRSKKDFPTKHTTMSSPSSQGTQSDPISGSPKRHSSRSATQFSSPGRSSESYSRPTTLTAKPAAAAATTAASYQLKNRQNDAPDKMKSVNKQKSPVVGATIHLKSQHLRQKANEVDATAGRERFRTDDATDDLFSGPIVKSPPEPTRLKSPEQLMIRSPEPVVWTVPLDTGKTFTVTQSILGVDDKHVRFSDGILKSALLAAGSDGSDRKSVFKVSTLAASNKVGGGPIVNNNNAIVESKIKNGLSGGDEKQPEEHLPIKPAAVDTDCSTGKAVVAASEATNDDSRRPKSEIAIPSDDIKESATVAGVTGGGQTIENKPADAAEAAKREADGVNSSGSIIDSALNRFDNFWGKTGNGDKQENVVNAGKESVM